jgi:four helix bundle protein
MGVSRVDELIAFQLALEFKREVYRIVESSEQAKADFRFRAQLFEAASGVEAVLDEGFNRNVPGEFAQFIRYALGSLAEARRRLRDGIHRRYFTEEDCHLAFNLGKRCCDATRNLHRSLWPFLKKRAPRRKQPR